MPKNRIFKCFKEFIDLVVKDDAIDSIEMIEEVQSVDVKEEVVKNVDEEEEEVIGHKDSK